METNQPVPVKKANDPRATLLGLLVIVVVPLLIPINVLMWRWALG